MSGSPNGTSEQVALAVVLQIIGHVQVGVHARLEHGDAAQLVELRRMGVVVEGPDNEHTEVGIAGLASGGHQIARHRARPCGSTAAGTGPLKPSPSTRVRASANMFAKGGVVMAGPGTRPWVQRRLRCRWRVRAQGTEASTPSPPHPRRLP